LKDILVGVIMSVSQSIKELRLRFRDVPAEPDYNGNEWKLIRRIILSGSSSIIILLIILYTLPLTILSTSSLIEYSTIITFAIFLFILLIRYFGILFFSYFFMNEYTFKSTNGFKPFVSIIIPVFNEARVLQRSVSSLLNLDYENYEIIIINDGSTDNTGKVAEALVGYQKSKYGDVKISLINKPNGG